VARDIDSAIDVICFDLGGVLVQIAASFAEARELAGIPARELPEGSRAATRTAARAYQCGELACKEYFDTLESAVAGIHTRAELERIHDAWTQAEYPGAGALLAELRTTGRRLACLSNTNAAHWARLAPERGVADPEYPSLAALDVMLASHILGVAKPDPAIYARALAELGTTGDRVLFFDDMAENVAAARASGWCAEQVDPRGDPVAEIRRHLTMRGLA
jgi:glucose-1-phosphatase